MLSPTSLESVPCDTVNLEKMLVEVTGKGYFKETDFWTVCLFCHFCYKTMQSVPMGKIPSETMNSKSHSMDGEARRQKSLNT